MSGAQNIAPCFCYSCMEGDDCVAAPQLPRGKLRNTRFPAVTGCLQLLCPLHGRDTKLRFDYEKDDNDGGVVGDRAARG